MFRNFWSGPSKKTKPKQSRNSRATRRLTFERLEDRRMLSASPLLGLGAGAGVFGPAVTRSTNISLVPTTPALLAATTTTLAASSATSTCGTPITLTATVAAATGTPTGLVQFLDGTSVIGTARVRNGVATLYVSNLAVNLTGTSHSLTAQYLGDTSYVGSTSTTAVNVTVTQSATITLLSTRPNPVAAGQAITLSATVLTNNGSSSNRGGCHGDGDGGTTSATGTVEFDATDVAGKITVLGTGTVTNGVATFSTTTLPTGVVSVSAVYKGDTNYITSSSQAFPVSVSSTLSSIRIKVSPASGLAVNVATTLSLNVKPGRSSTATAVPTGTVTVFDATTGTILSTTPVTLAAGTTSTTLATGSLATTFTTTGRHILIVTYSGDANYTAGQSSVSVYVPSTASIGYGGDDGFLGGFGFGGFGGFGGEGRFRH